jgi:hypothetical protein
MDTHDSLRSSISRFILWLDSFGEVSQDQYDLWASSGGGRAKALYYAHRWGIAAVAPFVLLDSFLPATRALFRGKSRFPIADAHYAMGFFNLYRATGAEVYRQRGVIYLEALKRMRCPGERNYCWGYPFDWVGTKGTVPAQTPLITTTPYVYEAFAAGYELDGDEEKLRIMRSIADHTFRDLHDNPLPPLGFASSYTTREEDHSHVVNATAYRAFLLTDAGYRFGREDYVAAARKYVDFVVASQNPDGSWCYAADGSENFVDNFHTCFVLKSLAKIERLTGGSSCSQAIDKGFTFYTSRLLDRSSLPIPFAVAPRMTLHTRELYDYAECLNLCFLLEDRYPRCREIIAAVGDDLLSRWQKPDGSFLTRKMVVGWNKVPYHRWAQSQTFRSLTLWLLREAGERVQPHPMAAAGR